MSFYASYPSSGSGGVPTYANLAAFPTASSAGNGSLAIALDTDILYISNGTIWEALADPAISPLAITQLHGDAAAVGPGNAALTLTTVNSNVGSFGDASHVGAFTVNGKGLTTAASSVSIQIAESQVTNLVSDLAAKQSTTLTNKHLLVGNVSNVATDVAASGDLTLANTGAFTFNTVNSNVGSFGTASSVAAVTVNAKGLTTAAASTPIQIAESQVTNLVTDLAAKQSTTLTNSNILVGNVSNVATDVAMSGDVTIANTGATTIATSAVTNTKIGALAVTNAKIANATIDLTAKVTGVLPVANGGTNNSSAYTAGSVVYSNGTSLTQDNANLFYDATNKFIGVGTATPGKSVSVKTGTAIAHFGQLTGDYSAIWLNGSTSINNHNISSSVSDQNLYLSRPSGLDIIFRDGNVNQNMIIKGSTGNVKIGTGNPATLLDVGGTITCTNLIDSGLSASLPVKSNASKQLITGAIDLSSATEVTGATGIANGGTGQTTANPAFNALSPLTTKGDIIAYGTVNARLPVGSNGQVLTADSTQPLGIKYAAVPSGTPVVARYTTAAAQSIPASTITVIDFGTSVIDTNSAVTTGASWHFTVPTTGYYLISASISFGTNGFSDAKSAQISVRVNGTLYSQLGSYNEFTSLAATQIRQANGSDVISLNATDTVDVVVFQNNSASKSLAADATENYISIIKY